ncbi:MAG: redox-sensing transcriptional repressor Rex [Chloroflexi bacterium]|nr:redox-sensing transcriptional repressor Rex [Chloroflexota bacterium]
MPLEIPEVVIDRLPIYRGLLSRIMDQGRTVISSHELGIELDVTPAQIRKDLSYFGRFGKQGKGYIVQDLLDELENILGLDRRWTAVVIGIGRLGRAVASYPGFEEEGFDIVACYDTSPDVIGTEINGIIVQSIDDLPNDLKTKSINIGIVTVSSEYAQKVTDLLINGGVTAILNYTPSRVQVPREVELRNINPVLFLQSMTYHLKKLFDEN